MAATCLGADTATKTNAVRVELAQEVCSTLESTHMSRRAPDDVISRRAFTNLLEMCDGRHMVFLAGDIAEFAKSQDQLDDFFKAGDFSFARRVHKRYRERLKECTVFATNALAHARRPSGKPAKYVFDRSKEPWPSTVDARNEIWLTRLASETLVRPAASVSRTYVDTLEAERKRDKDASDEDFVTSLVSVYDAHTMYLSPKMSGLLEAQLKLPLCGVGAQWNVPDAPVTWKGAATLDGEWKAVEEATAAAKAAMRFFKVVVEVQ